ncbi:MAG TPA: ACT domain-containing protein [Candidatus Acidoferrum sp.]|nr:ACT domain-containing protein [Candidatus Acidoferrum sp.]
MHVPLVMTIIGPDRTGLVESVARVVAEQGGNWLESRMCRLGGEFAGILRIELPVEKRQTLITALQTLQGSGLTVVVRPGEVSAPLPPGRLARLEVVGHDRPGIVRQITRALADAGVNVEDFFSECVSAPMSGETLFKAVARLQLPAGGNEAALKADLEKIADDLLVDVSFVKLDQP